MTKRHAAILIDPEFKTVEYVTVDSTNTHKEISRALNADLFDAVRISHEFDYIYVDDSGLLKPWTYGFTLPRYNSVLVGRGLILGTDEEGECTDTTIPLEDIREEVLFVERYQENA